MILRPRPFWDLNTDTDVCASADVVKWDHWFWFIERAVCIFSDKSWMHTPEALAKHYIPYNVKVCSRALWLSNISIHKPRRIVLLNNGEALLVPTWKYRIHPFVAPIFVILSQLSVRPIKPTPLSRCPMMHFSRDNQVICCNSGWQISFCICMAPDETLTLPNTFYPLTSI